MRLRESAPSLADQVGQECNRLRECYQDGQAKKQGQQEGPDSTEDGFQRDVLSYAFNDVNIHPNRGGNDPHRDDQDNDYSEPDGIVAQYMDGNGEKNGNRQQNQGQGVDKAS